MKNNPLQCDGSGEFSNRRNRHNFVLEISAVINLFFVTSLKRTSTSEAPFKSRIIIFLFEIFFFFIFFLIFYLLLSVFRFTLFFTLSLTLFFSFLFSLSKAFFRSFLIYRCLAAGFTLIIAMPVGVFRLLFSPD